MAAKVLMIKLALKWFDDCDKNLPVVLFISETDPLFSFSVSNLFGPNIWSDVLSPLFPIAGEWLECVVPFNNNWVISLLNCDWGGVPENDERGVKLRDLYEKRRCCKIL